MSVKKSNKVKGLSEEELSERERLWEEWEVKKEKGGVFWEVLARRLYDELLTELINCHNKLYDGRSFLNLTVSQYHGTRRYLLSFEKTFISTNPSLDKQFKDKWDYKPVVIGLYNEEMLERLFEMHSAIHRLFSNVRPSLLKYSKEIDRIMCRSKKDMLTVEAPRKKKKGEK